MNRIPSTLLLLALTLIAASPLQAQALTEALQKQIWPGAAAWQLPDWEMLLPDASTDTIFYPKAQVAEVVTRDATGRPAEVVLFIKEANHWQPQTASSATFDRSGNLVALATRDWREHQWQPSTNSCRTLDATGQDQAFRIAVHAEGKWQNHYVWSPTPSKSISYTAGIE